MLGLELVCDIQDVKATKLS